MIGVSILLAALAATPVASASASDELATAYLAGGCFWCMEADFEKLDGVVEVVSGYMGGTTQKPTYESVGTGTTGHTETVAVRYQPDVVSYAQLVDYFWRSIDPLTPDAQFCDEGSQYRSAIFTMNDAERATAETSRTAVEQQLGGEVATEIHGPAQFHPAEDYHQDYYRKNPIRYRYYRYGCGRDARLKAIWGDAALRKPQ